MIIRDKITLAMKREGLPESGIGVRELVAEMPDETKTSVSKECGLMADCGLLTFERVQNGRHGWKFIYRPTEMLLRAGTFQVCEETVIALLVAPMNLKELRYAMTSATGTSAPRRQISSMVDDLALAGKIVCAQGGTARYPRYVQAGYCGSGIELDVVAAAWARLPWTGEARVLDGVGARRQGSMPRWLQPRPGE